MDHVQSASKLSGLRVATGIVSIFTSLWAGVMTLLLSVSVGIPFSVTFLGTLMAVTALGMLVLGVLIIVGAGNRGPLLPRLLLVSAGLAVIASAVASFVGPTNFQFLIAAFISVLPLTALTILVLRKESGRGHELVAGRPAG